MTKFNIPQEFTQGDRVTWSESNVGHDLNNTLACFIRGATPLTTAALDLTGVVDGSFWNFTISTQDSSSLTSGTYRAQFVLFDGSNNRMTLGRQDFLVFPSIDLATNYDGRSKDEIELDKIETAIASMMSNGGVAEYYIGERRVRYFSLDELFKERDRLRRRVAIGKNPRMLGGRNIQGGFC